MIISILAVTFPTFACMPNRYFLEIAYNGTPYHGWQVQPNVLSVQQRMNEALSLQCGQEVYCIGCGRTDTGVHARQYFLHFDLESERPPNLVFRLNRYLEGDIAVKRLLPVAPKAHARYDATARTYQYHIHQQEDPFLQKQSYFLYNKLDFELMRQAAGLLLNYIDFKPLSKHNPDNKTTLCNITEARWEIDETRQQLLFVITGNRFLWNMVRMTVGALLMIGRGKLSIAEFETTMQLGDSFKYLQPVPAHGLYLQQVKYPYING